jgi:hypothetical protein
MATSSEDVARENHQRRQDAEVNAVRALADRIDQERAEIVAQLETATGLRRRGLERRLAQLNALEREAERRLAEETAAIETPTEPAALDAHTATDETHPGGGEPKLYARDGRRFVPLNGQAE